MRIRKGKLLIVAVIVAMFIPAAALAKPPAAAPAAEGTVQITLLHTNDFHGRLEADSSGRGGSANIAGVVNSIRDDVGAGNVALLDAGDVYFAAPAISQLLMGESTIDVYNLMGYDVATFGNHEFDKGQTELAARVGQSDFPWLGANVVLEGTDWDMPPWAQPYELLDIGGITLGVLGLAGEETPGVTLIGTTEGLVFKDLTETILHYYDEVMAAADAMVVLVHMGTNDSGPYEGLTTVAQALIDAGKPVDLMIGGHQHQAISAPVMVGDTAIVSAGYYGRWLGQVDVSINTATRKLTVDSYQLHTILEDSSVIALMASVQTMFDDGEISAKVLNSILKKLENAQKALTRGNGTVAANLLKAFINEVTAQAGKAISAEAADALLMDANWLLSDTDLEVAARVAYWADIVAPIVNEPVILSNIDLTRDYNDESLIGDIVTDSMLWKADEYDDGEVNGSVDIAFTNPGGLRADIVLPPGETYPFTVTWGDTFDVLPFGNTLYMMDLTGAQIQTLLDQSANLYKGILQTAGASWYWYNDCGCNTPTAWGAYGVEVEGAPLDRDQTYRVVTNNFLAGGQDGWTTFAEGVNRWDTYYDMQQGLVEYLGTFGDGVIDEADIPMERIVRLDDVVTMLHTNDTHGIWPEAYYYGDPEGFAFLASVVKAERAHNPNVLLLDAGDTFQGNAFAQYFRNSNPNPIAGGMNLLGYDAMTIGNHEFNFGPATFASMLGQVEAPLLGTINLDDDGSYGFINENVDDYINLEVNGKKVTIFGLTNPRVYRYELPTNIPGLTFYSGLDTGFTAVPEILAAESPDLLVGLTHMGYAPYGDEIDSDLLLAEGVAGIDVIIGGHSHSFLDPAVIVTSDTNPDGTLIAQTGRYALNLGKVNVGFIDGEIVLREGYLIPAGTLPVDAEMMAYLSPFEAALDAYTGTEIGQTTAPIDALDAYTQETSGANVQADAAVFELTDNGIAVDFHLSGAMSNRLVASGATPASPVTLTVDDMYTLMPYENSLLVMEMNGPQIKEVLERGYRNWWWYNQGYPWGGYSHYTTCMLTTDSGNVITYAGDLSTEPDGTNVAGLTLDGAPVDFTDATTYYNVSTVNYLAAGSCNFNNAGVTIWPLDQIVADTQFYVRDSVIDYITAMGTISPAVEGRLVLPAP